MLSVRKKEKAVRPDSAPASRITKPQPRANDHGTPMPALAGVGYPGLDTDVERGQIIMAPAAGRILAEGGRPDSNRNLEDHDLGCCRYTTTTMRSGDDRTRTGGPFA